MRFVHAFLNREPGVALSEAQATQRLAAERTDSTVAWGMFSYRDFGVGENMKKIVLKNAIIRIFEHFEDLSPCRIPLNRFPLPPPSAGADRESCYAWLP